MPGSSRLTATCPTGRTAGNGASAGVLPGSFATREDYAGAVPPFPSPDTAGDPSQTHGDGARIVHDERLHVPLWWWPVAAIVIGLLGYEIQLAMHGSDFSPIVYAVLVPLAAWLLWSMGRTRVWVADGELWAGKAHLPITLIDRAASIPASAKSAAMGRQLDPAAFLAHKFWIKTMVLLVLDDPDDPTPYWLVSTRRPAELIAALGTADAAAESAN